VSVGVDASEAALGRVTPRWRAGSREARRGLHIALHAIFILGSVLYLLPFAWMVSTSLKLDGREIAMPPQWIPNPVVWENYYRALTALPMLWFLRNTLIITVISTCLGLLSASLAGFAFARLRFPGRNVLFSLCLATLMLPGIVTLIPEFLLFRQIGWISARSAGSTPSCR
jgi:multiple sugar transport system permease protein